jgi:arabinofuranan 3-O-arabinosyltransferase
VPCGGPGTVALAPGSQRFTATAAPLFDVTALTLIPKGQAAGGPKPRPIGTVISEWNATERVVEVERRNEPGVLAIRENVNPGWRATLDGEPLETFTVDGWQQGWILPPGAAGTVKLTFQPDGQYRLALAAGAAGLAFVLLVGLLPARLRRRPAEAWGGWGLLVTFGAAGIVLFGGIAGLVLLVLLTIGDAALWWWGSPRLIRKVRWVAPAAAYGLAGMLLTAFPWPKSAYFGDNAVTQLLVLAALTALWVTCGAGEWLAETVVGWALRRRGSSPSPPDTPQRT